ncbi:hypothetical protein CBW22_24020 [Pantoea sp. VS1]|uniref:Ig-like domain-containing protein n=1 Tax=Pantoea sp. VS1 TaxID=2003658 RepID=UPI000B504393|nr:Ig-like domain-containing protein [Pantoea sp. VS1]OWS73139.1 hypothetical protein CBW22_24020 [Pantoea sp. VS1]
MSTALTNAKQFWTTNPQHLFTGSMPTEAGGIMEIVMDETVYTVSIAADGSWSWQPPFPLAEGPHNLSVRTIDRAGNVGAPSLLIVNVDLTAPDQPLIIGAGDDFGDKTGLVGSGQQTDDRTPTLKGVAEPDSIVRLYNEQNQLIGSVKASSNGYWEITPTLADGEHALYVTATDGRGYVSQASEVFTLTVADDTAVPVPGKVEITHAQDNAGAAQGKLLDGALTDDTTPTLRGTAPAGSNVLIQYRDVNGQWVDGGYATLSGTEWSWTPDKALGEGKWEFRAYAGSGWTDEFTLEIDLTPQSELSITHAWDDAGIATGILKNNAITDDRTPTLYGRAEANSIIYIHFRAKAGNWELLGSTQALADGSWSYESDRLSPAIYDFSASDNRNSIIDGASTFSLNITDTTRLKPEILFAQDDVGPKTGQIFSGDVTDDTKPTFHGRSEANSIVNLYLNEKGSDDKKIYSVTTDNNGYWEFTPPFTLNNGIWQAIAESAEHKVSSDAFDVYVYTGTLPDHFKEGFQNTGALKSSFKVQGGTIFLSGEYYYQTAGGNRWIHVSDHGSATYELDYLTDEIKVSYMRGEIGQYTHDVIKIYDQHGKIIHQETMKGYEFQDYTYKTKPGQFISKIFLDFYFDDRGVNIDNFEYKPVLPKNAFDNVNKIMEIPETEEVIYNNDESSNAIVNVSDINTLVKGKLAITLEDVLDSAKENVFIENDHIQLMVTGKEGDIIRFEDMVTGEADFDNWTQQTGTVTIAGVQYEVYSHNGSDAELLVQEGVKVELI